jgi:Transposase DDE domain group 1
VVPGFDGSTMTTQPGAMLLGATDRQIRLIERFAGCFIDHRAADLVVHEVSSLVGQRVFGIALGYEDLIDPDQLRHDPVKAVLDGMLPASIARFALFSLPQGCAVFVATWRRFRCYPGSQIEV